MDHSFSSIIVVILWNFAAAQDAAPDVGTSPADLIFPLESDSSSNASVVSLPRLFPTGSNFSITSLDFLSQSAGESQSSGALYLDDQMSVFRSQESLRKYLGGVFRLRVTIVSAETGIQTAEEIRLPVVDKTYRLKLTSNQMSLLITANKFEILSQLKSTVFVNGKNLEFVPEKSHNLTTVNGKSDTDWTELCFYAIQGPGFPVPVRDILPHLQRNESDLMMFFYDKYEIRRITYCSSDLVVTSLHMDGLSIGLLVLAIALAIFLVAAIVFVCCWIRMKKLHAAVLAAQPPPRSPSSKTTPPSSQFTPSKDVPVYHVDAPLSVSQWSAVSVPTFSFGMGGVVPLKSSYRRPPSSCDAQYEWQESSLDLAGDADSINQSINRSLNDVFNHTTSSSAQSISEDSVSCGRKTPLDNDRGISPMNTQL